MPHPPPAGGRVDSWDDPEDAPAPRPPAPAARPDQLAPTLPDRAPGDVVAAADAPEPHIPWRQAIRGAPGWLWLITLLSIGAICIMFTTILLLILAGR